MWEEVLLSGAEDVDGVEEDEEVEVEEEEEEVSERVTRL